MLPLKRIKLVVKYFIPPIVCVLIRKKARIKYGWFGDYANWDEAKSFCKGYDSSSILEKVKDALLEVKAGKAVYERDSVLFYQKEYVWPLLSIIFQSALRYGELNVIDFGGSLGSSYFQNRTFFENNVNYVWNVVEQEHFVQMGKKYFKDSNLSFNYTIDDCYVEDRANILILSSVLQYLPDPESFIEYILNFDFKCIFIDRTSFILGKKRLTVQNVDPAIYEASYPCWFFNESDLLALFETKYTVSVSFKALDNSNIEGSYYKGFILKKND